MTIEVHGLAHHSLGTVEFVQAYLNHPLDVFVGDLHSCEPSRELFE